MASQVSWLVTERDIVEKMGYEEVCRAREQCPSDKELLGTSCDLLDMYFTTSLKAPVRRTVSILQRKLYCVPKGIKALGPETRPRMSGTMTLSQKPQVVGNTGGLSGSLNITHVDVKTTG